MQKSFALLLASTLSYTTLATAASYSTAQLPPVSLTTTTSVTTPQQTNYTYNCNWPYYPAVQYVIHKLRDYHVKSIIYPYSLRIVIPDYVLYESLTNNFIDTAKPPMNLIIALLHYLPGAKIKVIGYSDDIAIPPTNQYRTMLNAQKIAGVLWSNGFPATSQTLHYHGDGENNPISNNTRVNGMADNRRIEIVMSFPHDAPPTTYYK